MLVEQLTLCLKDLDNNHKKIDQIQKRLVVIRSIYSIEYILFYKVKLQANSIILFFFFICRKARLAFVNISLDNVLQEVGKVC